ncbi:hypothetical protein MRB53_016957 [Persea americana]|uniref:Uncharacterized protein n=1 Tax=Persea americana TaxID=3435 RepID=A0ACC2M4B3_PERAE|nr:hypothetical protein MRB53_016957 [Persea americana]
MSARLLRISLRGSREEDPEDSGLLLSGSAYRRTEKEERLLCTLLHAEQQRSEKKAAENPDFCCRTTRSSFRFLLQRGCEEEERFPPFFSQVAENPDSQRIRCFRLRTGLPSVVFVTAGTSPTTASSRVAFCSRQSLRGTVDRQTLKLFLLLLFQRWFEYFLRQFCGHGQKDVEGPVPLEIGKTRTIRPQAKENWWSLMDSNKMVAGARACLIELLELVLNAIGIVYDCSNIVRQQSCTGHYSRQAALICLECFRMFHSCGCCFVPMFGETEHDSSQQLTSVPIEEQLDAFGRVLDVGKAKYGRLFCVEVAIKWIWNDQNPDVNLTKTAGLKALLLTQFIGKRKWMTWKMESAR